MDRLLDGPFQIGMQSWGCWWWHGEIGKGVGEDGSVPAQLCGIVIAPLMLEPPDEGELRVRDGKVDQSR